MIWVKITLGKYGGVNLLRILKNSFVYEGILGLEIEVYMESLVIGYLALS